MQCFAFPQVASWLVTPCREAQPHLLDRVNVRLRVKDDRIAELLDYIESNQIGDVLARLLQLRPNRLCHPATPREIDLQEI